MTQNNWRWCNKCEGLAFAGNQTQGVCPTGGAHDHSSSGNYSLFKDVYLPIPYAQENWRWCRKCEGLTFAGNSDLGACPAKGTHDHTGSGNYQVLLNLPVSWPGYQGDWKWCNKCQALTFADAPIVGTCASDGVHDHSGSGSYSVHQG